MKSNSNDEIDLVDILKKLYKSRKLIIYITIVFSIIGVAFALLSPVKYNSKTVFITQNQETGSSSLSGVASLVGINLGSNSFGGEIPPTMYPQIIQSVKFKRLLLNKVINDNNNLTLENYIGNYYSIKEVEKQNISDLGMTFNEEKYFDILTKILNVSVNLKDGFISIDCEMPSAEYSAKVAKFSRELLQNIIIENKIETARQNLIFSEGQLIEKRKEFDDIYSKLAFFSDSNLNSVNSFVLNEKNKLESEFQIISSVVEEISKQVEQAKLQLKKDTPVFSTIQEAVIPLKRSSPKRTQLVIIFVFAGFVISCLSVLIGQPLKNIFFKLGAIKIFEKVNTISFELTNSNHILIECEINCVSGIFIVDTGASNSCINYLSSSKFNLEFKKSNETASSATNEINETYYSKNNKMKIGDFQKNDFDLVLFDMTFINNSLIEKGVSEVDGIIGGDILNELNVCINYKKKEISLEF